MIRLLLSSIPGGRRELEKISLLHFSKADSGNPHGLDADSVGVDRGYPSHFRQDEEYNVCRPLSLKAP